MMTTTMTREQATAAVAAQTGQRDGIQANLLELDGSFGKRLLEGGSLAGVTRERWTAAAADLAALWEIFTAYSAAVDRATALLSQARRPSSPELTQLSELMTGAPVHLTRVSVPLAQRHLTDNGRHDLTFAAAVAAMTASFASVTTVVSAAETVWNAAADGLRQVGADLDQATGLAGELGDDELAAMLDGAQAEQARLRTTVNADPLALWRDGRVDTARLDRLREQAAATVGRARELAAVRDEAQQRIAGARAAADAGAAAWRDAGAARDRAAAKVAEALLPAQIPDPGLAGRLTALESLAGARRWPRLAAELDALDAYTASVTERCRDAERASAALLGRRDELRGLVQAYQAKAGRLGAAEDTELAARFEVARDLLWTAPCDLTAAADAVRSYQEAVLKLSRPGRPS
jgi:hypothetical protein